MNHLVQKLFSVWVPVILIGMTGIPAHAQQPETAMPRGSVGLLQAIEAEISDLLEHNRGCVVRIHTIYGPIEDAATLGFGNAYTHGTGFLIDSTGHVLTVDKAVNGASEIRVTLGDGSVVEGEFVASDPTSDVAVIRVPGEHPDQVTFGNSDRVRVGHYSFILGNTFDQLLPSIGSVYEVNRDEDLIQIASSVHPSYGGAPVFNSSGHVVGMVWAAPLQAQASGIRNTSELPTSVFVIPINRAKRIAATLIERGEMAYGWLGVEVDRDTHPVVVTDVAVGGPAWQSGIRPGDQIVAYNGKPVAGPFHLERLVMETPPGIGVPIRVKRESITVATEAIVVGRQPVSRDRLVATSAAQATKVTVSVEASDEAEVQLFQQIQTLEQEIGRLRVLMEKK
jgi:S1-C subfamily serine protease